MEIPNSGNVAKGTKYNGMEIPNSGNVAKGTKYNGMEVSNLWIAIKCYEE